MKKINFSILRKILEIGEKKFSLNFSIPFKPLWKMFFLITIYWLIEIISYNKYTGSSLYSNLLTLVLCLLIILYPERGLYIFIPIMIFADDISKFNPLGLGGVNDLHSIWTFKIGSITFTYFFILSLLISIYIHIAISDRKYRLTHMDKAILFLIFAYLVGLSSGLYQKAMAIPKYALSDISPLIIILSVYFYIRVFFHNKETLNKIIELIYMSIGVKVFMDIIFFFLGYGVQFGSIIRVTNESGRVFYMFVFLYAIMSITHKRKNLFLHIIFGVSALFLIITYSGRMVWIFTFIGIIILYFCVSKMAKHKIVGISLSLIAVIIFSLFYSGRSKTIFSRFTTLNNFSISRDNADASTGTRIIETINIWEKLKHEGTMLVGAGIGNWFTDKYFRFPWPLGPADYRWKWRQAGTYFWPHLLLANIFFKNGILGLVLYFIFVYFVLDTVNKLRKQKISIDIKIALVSIYAYLPYLLFNHWSTKIRILLGLFLAVIANIELLARRNFSPE